MKFRVTMKDPDGVYESLRDATSESLKAEPGSLDEDEIDALTEIRQEKLGKFTEKWITYSEYITVEFDTEAGTCVVVPVK